MIAIKGLRQGLLIVFSGSPNEPWLAHLRELEGKLNANAGFFKGGSVAFDVQGMALSEDDLRRSVALLQAHDVTLWAVISQDAATQSHARAVGLADRLAASEPKQDEEPSANGHTKTETEAEQSALSTGTSTARATQHEDEPVVEGTDGLLVRRRVRSGQVLRHPGHVIVIGDVNPGAQLIAGGDIIVWGRLQGAAHAGALGDGSAAICALEMSPSLIKIADATRALRPGELRSRNRAGKAEMAQLKDQQIVFTPWEKNA